VAAVAVPIAVAVPVPIPIPIPITVPEYAPIAIVIIAIEAARAPAAIVKKPATDERDLLGGAELVLRQSNIGRAGEAHRIRAVGQQRRTEDGCGGQRDKQELVHFRTSSFFWSGLGQADQQSILWLAKCARSNDLDCLRRRDQIAGTSLWWKYEQQ
jgi:hypothetical protein